MPAAHVDRDRIAAGPGQRGAEGAKADDKDGEDGVGNWVGRQHEHGAGQHRAGREPTPARLRLPVRE